MLLFAGPDVEARPGWLRNPWLLAILAAGMPVDLTIALVTGMPRLGRTLDMTELSMPAATLFLIRLGAFLADWWLAVLPPLVIAPLVAAWRWRERAVLGLRVWLAALVVAFVAVCAIILLPVKTIIDASG
jgi:hypothetical protein